MMLTEGAHKIRSSGSSVEEILHSAASRGGIGQILARRELEDLFRNSPGIIHGFVDLMTAGRLPMEQANEVSLVIAKILRDAEMRPSAIDAHRARDETASVPSASTELIAPELVVEGEEEIMAMRMASVNFEGGMVRVASVDALILSVMAARGTGPTRQMTITDIKNMLYEMQRVVGNPTQMLYHSADKLAKSKKLVRMEQAMPYGMRNNVYYVLVDKGIKLLEAIRESGRMRSLIEFQRQKAMEYLGDLSLWEMLMQQ